MKKLACYQIDDFQINAQEPFLIVQDPSRQKTELPEYLCQGPFKLQAILCQDQFPKIGEEVQHIDQCMLRYGSVSSLRDHVRFGPPPQTKQFQPKTPEIKTTLYINEFVEFYYDLDI